MSGRIKEWKWPGSYAIVIKPIWSDPYDIIQKLVVHPTQDDACDQRGRLEVMRVRSYMERKMVNAVVIPTSGNTVSQVRDNINREFK